jgi:hypothetical protein
MTDEVLMGLMSDESRDLLIGQYWLQIWRAGEIRWAIGCLLDHWKTKSPGTLPQKNGLKKRLGRVESFVETGSTHKGLHVARTTGDGNPRNWQLLKEGDAGRALIWMSEAIQAALAPKNHVAIEAILGLSPSRMVAAAAEKLVLDVDADVTSRWLARGLARGQEINDQDVCFAVFAAWTAGHPQVAQQIVNDWLVRHGHPAVKMGDLGNSR